MSNSQHSQHSHANPIPPSPPAPQAHHSGNAPSASPSVLLRALVPPSVAVFVALAPPILSALGSSTSSTLAALVPHIAHAVLLVLAGVYLYLIVQVPWDLYQVAARRADALALLESSSTGADSFGPNNPSTPKSKQQQAAASRSASASSSSAAASCTIHATFTLHPPDGPARWLARGAFAMSLASPIVGSALLLAVKSRLRDAWWIPLELLDPVPFALAASIRPLLHLAASAARAAASTHLLDAIPSESEADAQENMTGSAGPAAAAARANAEMYSSSSRVQQHYHHHGHSHPHSHPHAHHVHRATRFADPDASNTIPATWLPDLNPPASSELLESIPTSPPPSSWSPHPSSSRSIHTHLAALRNHLALHLKHLDAALLAASSSPSQNAHPSSSLSPRPSSFSLLASLLESPTSWLSAHLPRPSLHVAAYLPSTPPIRTWATWLLLGWLRWIVACIVLPLAAWITMLRATWWVLTLVPKQVIRHAIEAPPPPPPAHQSAEAKRRRRGSVPANDELAAEAPAPATAGAALASTSAPTTPAATDDAGGSTSVVEDTASLVDALLSRVLPAGIYSAPVHRVHSKQRHASPAPATGKSGSGSGGRSRTRSRGARVSQLRPLSALVVGAAAGPGGGEHKRPATEAAQ